MFTFDPEQDIILTAYAQTCSGPGWSNSVIVAVIQSRGTPKYRVEYIQPEDQTRDMVVLFAAAAAINKAMIAAVDAALIEDRKRAPRPRAKASRPQ